MFKIKRVLIVLSLAAVPLLGPIGSGSPALAADPPGLSVAKKRVTTVLKRLPVVVKKPVDRKTRGAPAPLLGVGLPAFAMAGAAFAGLRFWRRRRSQA